MPPSHDARPIPNWEPLAARLAVVPDTMRVAVSARHLGSGSTLDHDAERTIMAASTIKTLILTAIARKLDAGELALDAEVTITEEMRAGGSGVLNWMHEGITLPVRDLAWLMIAISDNTASNAMIETAGLANIQQTADELGVPSLRLVRPFIGRAPDDGKAPNQVTARGLTDLLTAIWNDTAASSEQCAWMRQLHADQQHVDRLPRDLPDGVTYAGKTGSLDGISHDTGVITGPTGAIAISVLVESRASKYDDNAFIGALGAAVAEIVS